MWRRTNASGTHDVVDDNLGCGRRHLSVNISNHIKRVLICGRWISHGQLFTSEPWENQRKLVICITNSISHKHSMGLHKAWRFKMLNRVSVNEFIKLSKIFYNGTTVWGHSKMEKKLSWWRHQLETFYTLPALSEGIHITKANDTEFWCFLWSAPEQTVEQTIKTSVIWNAIALIIVSL